MDTNVAYYQRALQKRIRRQREVRKNIIILIMSIFIVVFSIFLIASLSTQASDFEHTVSYKYYKSIQIESGDSLWSIANTYCDENYQSIHQYVDEVKTMNSLKSDTIKAGNYIIIPYYSDEFH